MFKPSLTPNIETTGSVQPWRRWLRAFDGFNLIGQLQFTTAIWVVYLASHGYSPLAIGLFEMLFHIVKFLSEVPTGIFADLVGRRKSLVLYCVCGAISHLLFLVPGTPILVLSFCLSGLSFAFFGGSNQAILWNIATIAEPEGSTALYGRLVSRMYAVGLIGEIIGTVLGGYLGNILQILPFILHAVVQLIAIGPLLLIPEQRGKVAEDITPLTHFKQGLQAVWASPAIFCLIIILGLVEACWQTIYYYYQLSLHDQGFSLSMIGLVVTISTLGNFLFAALSPLLMKYISERLLIGLCLLAQMVGLLLMGLPWVYPGLFGYMVLFQASLAVISPAISTAINRRSPEAQRATILSFQTGLFSASMIVLFPLFGLGLSHASYQSVYLGTLLALLAGCLITIGFGLYLKMKRGL